MPKYTNLLVSEKISLWDAIVKYTLRDFFLGTANIFPSSIGYLIRRVFYKLALRKCGEGLLMKPFATILFPERVSLGNHVSINEYSLLDGDGELAVGDFTRISAHVKIITHILSFEKKDVPLKLQEKRKKGVTVGKDVLLGAGCTLLPGITIGDGAIIGAGAVVTKDVRAFAIMAGVPAKEIGERGK
ncbi:acyltransferase [Candidatus Woesearchaeota archaeon]|nr:acyltransferase [Candidatus Woesearchaeota archaeon]